jgi:hypothetical protein
MLLQNCQVPRWGAGGWCQRQSYLHSAGPSLGHGLIPYVAHLNIQWCATATRCETLLDSIHVSDIQALRFQHTPPFQNIWRPSA